MKDAAPKAIAIQKVLTQVLSEDQGRLIAGLIAKLGDFQLAEDALQDAAISALGHWGRSGIPNSPTAWLMKVAHNKAIDRIRTNMREDQKVTELGYVADNSSLDYSSMETIPDERLRLIFTCCHPALEDKSRVALTLRTVCNLTTTEIANAFLDAETTMGQRLSRAKAKIKAKGISFSVPEPEQWPERLATVLSTLYLIFTTGYVSEDNSARDLCKEGLFLVRLLEQLRTNDSEIEGALALMLLTEARRKARINQIGASEPIESQDRKLWQQDMINEGQQILETAMQRGKPGPFQIKAAIADCHMMKGGPDWQQIALLYQSLWRFEPTPVVALNWAVVMAEIGQVAPALERVESLEKELREFQPWHAARASLLSQLNRHKEAAEAYKIAVDKAPSEASRIFLTQKLSNIRD